MIALNIQYSALNKQTAILILAAGNASRMGAIKQVLRIRGKALINHAIDESLKVAESKVYVVMGANVNIVHQVMSSDKVDIIYNAQWKNGFGSSIAKGVEKIIRDGLCNACIISVADQPLIRCEVFEELILKSSLSGKGIVSSDYGDMTGPPVYFSNRYFDDLLALNEDIGAKEVIKKYKDDVTTISFPEGISDIDTLEDLEKLNLNS